MLKFRLITALILVPAVIAALFLLHPFYFAVSLVGVCTLAAWEWGPLAGFTACWQRIVLSLLGCLLLVTVFLLPHQFPAADYKPFLVAGMLWWLLALMLVLAYPRSAFFWQRSCILRLLFGIVTLLPFVAGMLELHRYHAISVGPGAVNNHTGAWVLLFVMFLVWGADSGAYLFGKLFGRHKLLPRVSPGKTWEGVLGGVLTSAVIAWLFGLWAPLEINSRVLLISSVCAVLASVLGDLAESMFKREAGIKDSGNIIPGHGGILDRIDSLTAAVPVFSFMLFIVFAQG